MRRLVVLVFVGLLSWPQVASADEADPGPIVDPGGNGNRPSAIVVIPPACDTVPELTSYQLMCGFPTKFTAPPRDAGNSDQAVESIEIAIEHLERV